MNQSIHTVLIVDDCPEDCELYRRCLLQDKTHTYTFLEADSGQAGFALWQQHHPDLILLDYQLPDLDGLTWLTQLAAQTPSLCLPVIMVTGQGSEAITIKAIKAGAQDYLFKEQITPERLQLTVRVTLERVQSYTQLAAQTVELSQLTQDLQQNLEKLQISVAQYRSLFESIDEGFCIIEVLFNEKKNPVDFRFLQVNPAFERLSMIPDAVGKRMRDIAPQHEDYWFENVGKVVLTGESMRFENYAAAMHRWYDVFAFPTANPHLHHVGVLFTDTSDRKQSELQLREMSDALSNAIEGISRLDPQGRYLFVNEAYAQTVGYTPAEMIGMDWQRTVHPDDLEAVITEYQHMLKTGKVELEARGIRKDGSIFDKQLVMVSAYNDQHQFVGHHCFMKDITEKKQLEAQFLRAQRLESIGTLASGIAHDLNNILTPVLATAQLLPRKLAPLDPTSQKLLELLEGSAKRGRDLVQQVLSFARGQDKQRHILQVGYLLFEMGKIARQTFPKSIHVETQVPTDLWLLYADTTQLHQVLMNLCVNARDAMPDGGTLTIAAENCAIDETFAHMHLDARVGAYIKITIADTGIGIPPVMLDRIFDPFFTTKAQGQGTGLGLSTVRTIVKNHGGFLVIETALGQGTSFRVYLPALLPDEDTNQHFFPETALSTPFNGNGELILVVDDESAIRQTIEVVLETHGFRVLVAQDGIDALALYAQHQSEIDLVLMDVMMPTMDGFKLIEMLTQFMPPVPIIAMSGVASHQNSVLSHSQVQAFVLKPFTADALLTAIGTVHTSKRAYLQLS
jgi:two-component system, cell cycle sensor histidine kinase and response regulator CckA